MKTNSFFAAPATKIVNKWKKKQQILLEQKYRKELIDKVECVHQLNELISSGKQYGIDFRTAFKYRG